MARVIRDGKKSLVGQEFYEIVALNALSFCPDSNDASTPATQVHVGIQLAQPLDMGMKRVIPPFIARFFRPESLDAFIEAMIEHRTYVFGRREWDASQYPEQDSQSNRKE